MILQKRISFIVLIVSFFCSGTILFSAADSEDDAFVGLPPTPARVMISKKDESPKKKMIFSVQRGSVEETPKKQITFSVKRSPVETEVETEVKKIMDRCDKDIFDPDFKEYSEQIGTLLSEISEKNPERLKDIITRVGMRGSNIFHIAAAANDLKLVTLLLDLYPKILNSLTLSGNTALHLAYRYGNKDVIKFLKAQPDIDKKIKNKQGKKASQMKKEKDKILNESEGLWVKKL